MFDDRILAFSPCSNPVRRDSLFKGRARYLWVRSVCVRFVLSSQNRCCSTWQRDSNASVCGQMALGSIWTDHHEADAAIAPCARWLFSSSRKSRTSLVIVIQHSNTNAAARNGLSALTAVAGTPALPSSSGSAFHWEAESSNQASRTVGGLSDPRKAGVAPLKSQTPHQRKQTRAQSLVKAGAAVGRSSVTSCEDGQMMKGSFK